MYWGISRFAVGILALGLLMPQGQAHSEDIYDAPGYKRPLPGKVWLRYCETADAVDCVEYLRAIKADGTVLEGIGGNYTYPGDGAPTIALFTVPGTRNLNGEVLITGAQLRPGNIAIGAKQGESNTLLLAGLDSPKLEGGFLSDNGLTTRALVACPDGRLICLQSTTDLSMTWEMAMRLDWFVPTYLGLATGDSSATVERLASGARRLVVRGGKAQYQTGTPNEKDTMLGYAQDWGFVLWDGRDVFNGARCLDTGVMIAHANGWGPSRPRWNNATGMLEVSLSGFHYEPDGAEARGSYELDIPDAMVRCLWGMDPTKVNQLKVEITTDNGDQKVATMTINHGDGQVRFRAYNFTYSNPIVKITRVSTPTPTATPATVTPTPTATPVVSKRRTIVCVKGKTVKKVTGTNPKCPPGFKRR